MRTRVLIPVVVMLILLVASGVLADAPGGAPPSDGLKPGDVLDQRNWQRAEGLLPPEILKHFYYRTYYFGNLRAESQLNMMSPASLERRLDVDVRFMYYDGVPEQERVKNNPQNFLYQQLVVVMSPNDLQGTGSLSWRYRDPQKRDSSWAYVPALRRVRAVSPANRSDGFLGSDMSQDDGPFFDGKPEDFDWKLKGEVDQLRFVDPGNLEG